MNVTSPSPTPPPTFGSSAQPSSSNTALGKDEFVKLLMAQMSRQDPLSPMDSHAFVAQLAQFANVELLQTTNSRLEAMVVAQTAAHQTNLATLVGKEVAWRSDKLHLTGDGAELRGQLSGSATQVTAVVVDSNGREVRRMELGAHGAGPLHAAWDGRDDKGMRLPDGDYTLRLTANKADGTNVPIDSVTRARVSAVSFEKGYAELLANGARVMLGDVIEIREVPATTP